MSDESPTPQPGAPSAPPDPGTGQPAPDPIAPPAGQPGEPAEYNPWAPPAPHPAHPQPHSTAPFPQAASPAPAPNATAPFPQTAPPPPQMPPHAAPQAMPPQGIPPQGMPPQTGQIPYVVPPGAPWPYGPQGPWGPQQQMPYAGFAGYGGHPAAAPAYGMPYAGWPPVEPRNKLGTAALVLGIVGDCLTATFVGSVVGLPLGILALVFGLIGRRRARGGRATNGGKALAGVITGAVALAGSAVLLVALVNSAGGLDAGKPRQVALTSARGGEDHPLGPELTATYADGTWVVVGSPKPVTPPDGSEHHRPGATAYEMNVRVDETGDHALSLDNYGWRAHATLADGRTTDLELISSDDGPLSRDFPRRLASGQIADVEFAFDVPPDAVSLDFEFRPGPGYAGADWRLHTGG